VRTIVGWKPGWKTTSGGQKSWLSENHSGMETTNNFVFPLLLLLLSENHSGMETSVSFLEVDLYTLVEREPMWDGNTNEPST